MRSLILSFIFTTIAMLSYGQSELCLTAEGAPTALTPAPSSSNTLTLDPLWTSNADAYTPPNFAGPYTVGYWSFTVDATGYYNINIETPAVNTITTDLSVSLSDNSLGSACPMDASLSEIYSAIPPIVGSPDNATCTFFTVGTVYTLALAVAQGNEGDVIITVSDATGATNEDCAGATSLPAGTSVGDNSCSDGLVWYSYTVVNGGTVSVSVSNSGTPNAITTPVITQTNTLGCGNPDEGVTMWTCLVPGTVVYFEAGDDTAPIEQGDFNIDISDVATGVPNELCDDVVATPVSAPSCITTTLTDLTNNTTVNACQELIDFDGCGVFNTESTVWFAFTTDAVAQTVDIEITNGTISGATFVLIDGSSGCPVGATTEAGCVTTGSLMDQMVTASTTYFIAVATSSGGTDGDFTLTVTPKNPPANDVCSTGAIDISATAALGVEGTTACASNDPLDFCAAVTEDHVVYYEYTVDASILTNRNVTITSTASTITTGTAATTLGLGVFTDCLGTAYMNTPTSGDLCDALTAPVVFECVEPGTVLTIAVASTDLTEGDFNIMITEAATGTASNDVCDIATNPDITMETMGTNFCADGELNFCGMTLTTDHQVWYQYTNNTGVNVDLGLTFTNTGTMNSATDLSMLVLVGDCSNVLFNGTTDMDFCNILDAGEQVINCIENGETISILLGSPEDPMVSGPEGDFNIASNVISNAPANDECTGAIDITPPNTCEWTVVSGLTPLVSAENACPEDFMTFPAGCDFTMESTVWYSITVPNDGATYTLEIQNISDDAFLTIFEDLGGDCDNYGTPSINSDCETGAGPHGALYDDLVNGATYFIAVGDPTPVGGFDFEIKLNMLPDNDECMDAVTLAANTSTLGTTECATQEMPSFNSAVCADTDETNTVWYEVTVGPGEKGFNLTVTGAGTNPITMGDINAVVFETTAAGCVADAGTFVDEDCLTLATLTDQFECVGEGTYIIRISTSDANAGEFDILFEPLAAIMFDVCSDPDAATFSPALECEWMPATANTIGACPEAFDFGNDCGFDDFPVIWYQVTAPANATELDLMTVSSTAGTPFIAVFENLPADCDNITAANAVAGSNCYSGLFADLETEGSGTIDVMGGNTYYIGVGSNDLAGSSIVFEIKFITPPANDECVDAVILSSGVSQMGTTICATQEMPSYNSAVCADVDEENTVWYEFTVPAGVNGFDITVTSSGGNGFMGDLNIVVFESTAAGCVANAGTLEDEVCTTSGTLVEDFECIGPGTYVIRISTSEANEGDFDILVSEYTSPVVNDLCSNPTIINTDPVCEWYPIDANTIDACPEQFDFASDCGFDDFPVVWYEINVTDDNATEIQVNLISTASGNAFYSVFNGNPVDCEDLTPASISGFCETTLGENTVPIDIEANGPQTYLIGVGATDVNGSASIQLEIKVVVPPVNDDPCDAEVVATVGDINTTVMGSTVCATMDLDETACGTQDENSVWYEYTIPAGTTGFIVTLTENGDGQDFAVGVYEFLAGCMGNATPLDGDVPPDCALEDGGELKFTCLEENTTAYIMVSTLDAEAGDFELTIDPIVPDPLCIDNDLCDMADNASAIATPITDGGQVCVADCNTEACPWEFNAGACMFTDFPTVFYSVTTDANAEDATMTVILSSADGNPFFSVIEFDCAAPTAVTPESFCVEGDGAAANLANMEVDANTTYIIAVALDEIDAEGGDFELCVNVTTSCNDDPCSPYPLVNGDGVGSIALDCDNNIGSTSEPFDYVSADCDDPLLFASTVYFSYTVPDNVSSFTLFYTNDPVNGIQNTVGINIMVYDAANCAFQQTEVVDQQCIQPGNTEPMEIDCPQSGDTYLIQITSAAGDEGEFDILITETIQDDPCAVNDDCDFATVLDVSETCEWLDFADCNIQACPEDFSDPGGMCAFDASAVVWFTFTTPPSAVAAGIELVPGGVTDPTWALLIDNGCASPPTAVNNDVLCVTVGGGGTAIEEDIPIDENTTYYIVVGSESNIEGDFTLNIKIDVPPINDDPCINDDNPPLDLTGGGSHTGTTCCARGPKDENPDGTIADFENVDCSAATEDAAVWYMYTPSEGDDGYNIILESGGADPSEGPIAIEVYAGVPDQGCNGGFGQTLASSCADFGANFSIGNCLAPGEVLFIKVSTDDADENCGEFILTVVPATCGPMADECIDLAMETPIEPVTNPEFSIDYTCITGCLDYACPEDDANGGCGEFTQMPTVWFQVTADDIAAQMFTTVTPNGNWEPIWSVYSGPDCDNLSVVNFGGSPPCSNGDNTPELHQTSVFDDEPNYWIAVTIDPASLPPSGLDDGSFELCVATTINAIICLGELEGGACDDESLVMEIVDREIEDQPLEGPFCQGEEVTINISFFYDASESGADWLIGFVPVFGNGWDLTNFDYAANAPVGNGQTAQWYEEDGDCAPILQEPNPILCTFTDEDGNLQLCNQLCSPCSECPQQGMEEGDPLPSGYFWVSNGGNAGCDNDCSPGEGWGIGSITAQIDWTFTLMVKEFESYEDCIENNDLSIAFQSFSDGTAGCWEDPVGECLLDRAMFSPAWEIECEAPPAVEGPDEELCHDGVTDIFVQTVDGSTNTIIVEVEDNPFVTGENNHTFPGGTGTIQDDLLNLTNDVQIVIYNVYSEDETLPCPGVINQIEVTIYPELMATFPPVFVCEGDCTDITPDIVGGIGAPYTYVWSTGETTPSINVCPTVPTTYFVTVEDGLGCMDEAEVQVDVKPPVELLLPESIDVCKDDNFDPFNPDYIVCLDFLSGSSPFGVTWNAPPGLVGSPSGVFGECFIINELASSEFAGDLGPGMYTLSVTVTDFFGCMGETDMIVNITGELILVLDVLDLECGDTEATITATGFDAAGNALTTFFLYGGCPDDDLGDFLDEAFSTTGVVTFPPVDLLSYTCFTVVASTESGCQSSQDITIPLTEGIPIDITGTPDVCIGEEATITINNAGDYVSFVWTPDIGSTGSVTFTPDSTFTYFVEATDAMGCNSQETYTVTVNNPPTISLSGSTTFCEGGTASVTASGGVMYDWTSPTITGFPTTGETISVGEPGDVTLVMTDANGCSSDTTFTFTQEDIITIQLGDVNICDGMGDTVFVSSDFVNIEWYDATPTLVSDTTFYVITGAGSFSVQAQDGTTGCDAMGSFEVMDFMTPVISVTDTVEVCRLDSGIDSLCVNFNNQTTGSGGVWTQLDVIPGFTVDLSDLNEVCFEGAQTGCYAFEYATNSAQAPCEDVSEIMIVCVKACPCPSPATQPIDPICNIGTTNLEFAEVTTDAGTWSVESGPAGQDLTGILTGTIFDANGLLPGDYVVRFTLDNPGAPPACEEFSEQTITVFAAPEVTGVDAFMCNIDNGTDPTVLDLYTLISVDATDGGTWVQSSGTSVTITGGSTIMSSDLSTFPDTLTFTYTSGVEMGSPCPPAEVTVEIVVRDCNCPFVAVLADTLCNNGGLIDLGDLLLNPDGLAGTWTTTGNLVGADMFDPNGLPSGLYTITYTLAVSPGPTCDIAYSNEILIRRQSIAVPTTSEPPCSMDTGNGPTTSNLYDWLESGYSSGTWTQTGGTPSLTFTDNGLDMAVVDFDGQPIGSVFTFTFTTNDAEDPCTNVSVEVDIEVVDCNCPPIVLAPADDLCNLDGMIDLCALTAGSDPGSYTVTSIGGTDFSDRIDGCIFDATGLNPGEYVITFTLDQMVTGICEQFLTTNFNVYQYLTATIQDPPEVCSDPDGNGLMSLNFTTYVSNAGIGTWEDTDGAGVAIGTLPELQNVSFIGVPAGVYTFTYTIDNEEPCEDVVLTMEVSVTDDCNCPSIIPLAPETECNTDGPIDLTQYDDPMRPGSWSSTELTVENGNSLLIDGVAAGTYNLLYTIDETVPDCDSTVVVMITIGEPANAGTPAEPYRLCEGESEVISLESLLEGEDTGGTWSETTTSAGFDSGAGTFTTDNDGSGTYTFVYTIGNNAPCPDVSATVTVVIEANPIADAGGEKFIDCINTTAMLGSSNTTTGPTIEYSWLNTTTGEDAGNTSMIEVTNEGVYELTVLNTETGCSARSTVEVMKSDDLPTMTVTPMDISCFNAGDGGIVISDQSGGDGNYTYTLGTIETTDPNDFSSLDAGDYTITIMDGNECAQSYMFTINEPPLFAIDAGPDLEGDVGEEFTLTIAPFDTTGITSLVWSNFETGDVICSGLDCVTITVTPTENVTTYYVEAIDANGCVAFDEVQIRTQQIVDVVFPNIISPNGDNTNDRFYIKSKDVEQVISMKIFDRWGEKLFDASNFPPRDPEFGWDGTFNDKAVVPGVYVFTVEVLFVNGDQETFSGDVTVTDSE